jgi:hypothetical protein
MTTTNPDLGLIKVDCIGRVRTTLEHRKALVAAFDDSALSGPEFCSHHGIKYQTFATWLQKHRRATGAYASDLRPPSLLLLAEVEIPDGSLAGTPVEPVEIRLPGGALLLLKTTGQLPLAVALLRELKGSQPC